MQVEKHDVHVFIVISKIRIMHVTDDWKVSIRFVASLA